MRKKTKRGRPLSHISGPLYKLTVYVSKPEIGWLRSRAKYHGSSVAAEARGCVIQSMNVIETKNA